MGSRLHYSSHFPLRSETELSVPLELSASFLHISSSWWRRLPLTASICKYAVCIFTLALLSTTLKPDCFSFLGATDARPRSRLNQTRSRQRQTGYEFSRSSRCAPTFCTYVSGHGLVTACCDTPSRKNDHVIKVPAAIFQLAHHRSTWRFPVPFFCSVAPSPPQP